jgi:hypothetical protein
MSDIGTAMAGYKPDSMIVGWISVFAGRPFLLPAICTLRRPQNWQRNLKYLFTGILKEKKRGSPGQVSSSGVSCKSLSPPK